MNLTYLKWKGTLKGIFSPSIPYTPLLQDGNSKPFFGNNYEGQRYGQWDTATCWWYGFIDLIETRLTMLRSMNLIPQDTLDWLNKNGYVDSDGDFYLSRRWGGIISGVKDGGNDEFNASVIASVSGLIPHSMLPYDPANAYKDATRTQFNADYFNPNVITPAMKQMGLDFLKRFSIQAERLKGGYIGDISSTLVTYLKEGSLQIGLPVPQNGTWNESNVDYPVGRTIADHSVELYNFDTTQLYPFEIYDSYMPNLKNLSRNYYIPIITRVAVTPLSVNQPVPLPTLNSWMKIWFNIKAFLTGAPLPFPDTVIGRVDKS